MQIGGRVFPEVIVLVAVENVGRQDRLALFEFDLAADAMQSGRTESLVDPERGSPEMK
jgi:hypothetical protein